MFFGDIGFKYKIIGQNEHLNEVARAPSTASAVPLPPGGRLRASANIFGYSANIVSKSSTKVKYEYFIKINLHS